LISPKVPFWALVEQTDRPIFACGKICQTPSDGIPSFSDLAGSMELKYEAG
jgi:hypothetical protein